MTVQMRWGQREAFKSVYAPVGKCGPTRFVGPAEGVSMKWSWGFGVAGTLPEWRLNGPDRLPWGYRGQRGALPRLRIERAFVLTWFGAGGEVILQALRVVHRRYGEMVRMGLDGPYPRHS